MNAKLALFATVLLPLVFLRGQQPIAQMPSPEALRKANELQQRERQRANEINDLAGNIQTPADARKLVDAVAAEFSPGLPAKWATRSIRARIARAEYESAADPGALIPEQHIADAWNDFVEKIGAPQDTQMSAPDIHYLLDARYVSAQVFWVRGSQTIWTVPNIYALGTDGKVVHGARALEAISVLWLLGTNTEDESFRGIHEAVQKGHLFSDSFPHPEKPPAPGSVGAGSVSVRVVSLPVETAARQYARDHGTGDLEHAVEGLLNELIPATAQ